MRARKVAALPPLEVSIEDMSHDGRGVARVEGKTVFVHGALPGERVQMRYRTKRKQYDEGFVEVVLEANPHRVAPRCEHFGTCSACALQHLEPEQQLLQKQKVLLDNLSRIGNVTPEQVSPPISGPVWHYRRKARLSVKWVFKKEKVLIGFREHNGRYVADTQSCQILAGGIGGLLTDLSALVASLDNKTTVPQIEVAVGDHGSALIFRTLEPLGPEDRNRLIAFGREQKLAMAVQPGGPKTIEFLNALSAPLSYEPEPGLVLHYEPLDFVQVNAELNQKLVKRALALLDPGPEDSVLDLFCGLGNFSLPLARRSRMLTGVEGEAGLVGRARDNAAANGITNAQFFTADLKGEVESSSWLAPHDLVLIDPPRSGASEILPLLKTVDPQKIAYVSCHPGSLARDAGILVNEMGFRLLEAGVADMFPHTAHVESVALFAKA